jgi:hypothetical protein
MQEGAKQAIEFALTCGRSWQSPQTGFIQYCYYALDEVNQDTIPIVENFLFALALLRSKTADNIQEAKLLIDKLLHFQSQHDPITAGNFPIYLHEFPACKDRYLGAQILPIFYWIIQQFHTVLGQELSQRLEKASKALMAQLLKSAEERALSYSIAIRIGASAKVFGTLYHHQEWKEEGDRTLDSLHQQSIEEKHLHWGDPIVLGDLLVALQMLYPTISNSPWKDLWDYLQQTWHRHAYGYVGIPIKVWQKGKEPQVTLYDFFMGTAFGHHCYRLFTSHPIQLHAALIQPSEDHISEIEYPLSQRYPISNGGYCDVVQHRDYGLTAMYLPALLEENKGSHHLRCVWGDINTTHTLVCQGHEGKFEYKLVPGGIDLFFHLDASLDSASEKEKSREVALYLDYQEGLELTVNSSAATTFKLDQPIAFADQKIKAQATFRLLKGEGSFFGHLMRGNRPSQIALKGEGRFQAYDWQLFLRTVRRKEPCLVSVELRIVQ